MKRQLKRIFVLIVIIPMLMLSACSIGSGTPSTTPSPSTVTQTPSPSPSPAPTEWHSGVKTDYSGLTPYKPFEEKYTRLKDGAMPELIPADYGKLIPYIGETMYSEFGHTAVRRYGLMTQTGMIVTDPVYARVFQGSYYNYSTYTGQNVPFYSLTKIPDAISEDKPWDSEIYAVCATDGSWVTPFDYKGVYYNKKVIMLVRSHEKNDIDIMDYSGKILYNTKTLGCYSSIPDFSDYYFMSGYGDGIISLGLSDNRTVFIDALSGRETYTDYERCNAFSDGYAAAMQNGLYGYINKDLSMIIQPQYVWADYFYKGKSVVQYPDNSYAIIDQSGNILLKNQYYITKWDSSHYGVYDADNQVTYYDDDLKKLTFGAREITPLYNGWFFYREEGGVTVLKGNEKHFFKGVTGINTISGGLVSVYNNNPSSWQEGLLTLDGDVVIPMTNELGIAVVTSETTGETFAIASTYNSSQSYKVYNSSGEMLFSGNGYAYFNTQYDMFEVGDEFSFAYKDTAGRDVFRISLMQFVPD